MNRQFFSFSLRMACSLVGPLLLAACAGQTPPPQPSPAIIKVPVRAVERPESRDHARLIATFGGEYRAPQAQRLLNEIVSRLVAASERPDENYQVTLLDSPVVNAFALPSGQLYATRGLLALANDTAEIAAVLSHEIAHVTLRHASARRELEMRSILVSQVVADVLNDPQASAIVRNQSRYSIASFSRGQELEADQVGVRVLAKAGYDPYGAARFLAALERSGGLKAGGAGAGGSSDMLSTHPSTPERMAQALKAARQIGAPDLGTFGLGEADRARYLTVVDGITFGDNPGDGVLKGRRFLHPRLGITFTAPEGFTLDNTPKAVIGLAANGQQRLLFDALEPASGQSLQDIIRSSWSDPIDAASLTPLTVNGLNSITAISRGSEWFFRIAVVQNGATTFRLVFASRNNGIEGERAFQQALQSVRILSPEEARAVQPFKINLVTANAGDTIEKFAATMADDERARERFVILNGLERGVALKPGERYKVIVE
jgi:predicted Zn-dependent protease